jgi:hypothetical protein
VFTKALLMVALLLNWLAFRLVVSCSVAGTGEGGGGGDGGDGTRDGTQSEVIDLVVGHGGCWWGLVGWVSC